MKKPRLNQEILANQLILIDEEGKSLGQVNYDQAMLLAYDRGLDLVEVKPTTSADQSPTCKLMDYGKELYQQQKQASKQKAKQKAPEVKEIKLSFRIEEHDFQTKIKRAKGFFADGDKVRVFLRLMGREMIFKDKVEEIIERFRKESGAEYEIPIKRMGNQFSALLRSAPRQ